MGEVVKRSGQENNVQNNTTSSAIVEQSRRTFKQDFKNKRTHTHSGNSRTDFRSPHDFNFVRTKGPSFQITTDSVWNGSLSSLVSTENLTQELLKEAVQQLEQGLEDSQKLLSQRDKEIEQLRQQVEDSKKILHTDVSKQEGLLNELEKSQTKVIELEDKIAKLKRQLADNLKEASEHKDSASDNTVDFPECTCYCGSVCRALREVNDVKKNLEIVERKYANLKQKIRERRKQAEAASNRSSLRVTVSERAPGCVLQ